MSTVQTAVVESPIENKTMSPKLENQPQERVVYSYEEVFEKSLEYFGGDDLAAKIFVDKYALRDNEQNLLELTPEDMHWRVANEFARIESKKFDNPLTAEEIFSYLDHFKYIILQGSPMYGVGNSYQYVSLGNCFVLPSPEDSFAGIMYTDAQIIQTTCRRGGVGWSVSKLRPKHMAVHNAARTTSGMVSFMKRFSNTIREVGQHGRRGASLQSVSVRHPEIFDFIKIKQDLKEITGSNISVQFTNDFMDAVINDKDFDLMWPVSREDAESMGRDFPEIKRTIKAKDLWNEFVHSAWSMAEPGCMFIDRVHSESTSAPYGHKEISSNPCGEQFLPAYASCRLLLVNLYSYVKRPFKYNAEFDWDLFVKHVGILQRLGDDLVDLEIEKIDDIINKIRSDPESEKVKSIALDLWDNVKRVALEDRRTGCGFTGLGDCIAALGMKYASSKSLEFVEKMQRAYKLSAYRSSVNMAKEIGPFPLYNPEKDIESDFIKRIKQEDIDLYNDMCVYGRRNMTLLTVAPAGTVSCLTRTTSGLEPAFRLSYMRRKKGNPGDANFRSDFVDKSGDHWMQFEVLHKPFEDWMSVTGKENVDESPYYGSTANEINWKKRVRLQSLLQRHIDNSISTTVNLPEDVTEDVVSDIYLEAYKSGCKGMTIYRDNCRTGVLIDTAKEKEREGSIAKTTALKRLKSMPSELHFSTVKGKHYFVVVGMLPESHDPYELFVGNNGFVPSKRGPFKGEVVKEKRGLYHGVFDEGIELKNISDYCSDEEEALTRMVSTALRHGADVSFVVHQLEKTKGDLSSPSKAIARILKKHIKDGTKVTGEECPSCQGYLCRQDGCVQCFSCGWSKCS